MLNSYVPFGDNAFLGFDVLQVFHGGLRNQIFFGEISVSVEVVRHEPDYISTFIHKILQKEESNISVDNSRFALVTRLRTVIQTHVQSEAQGT